MQQGQSDKQLSDRLLHMTDSVTEELNHVIEWTRNESDELYGKLQDGLDYLRTYSGGPESEWMTRLYLDVPWSRSEPSFIGVICKRDPSRVGTAGLVHFMTIGMIWDRISRSWSFHS